MKEIAQHIHHLQHISLVAVVDPLKRTSFYGLQRSSYRGLL